MQTTAFSFLIQIYFPFWFPGICKHGMDNNKQNEQKFPRGGFVSNKIKVKLDM